MAAPTEPATGWRLTLAYGWYLLTRRPTAVAGMSFILLLLLFLAIFAPLIAPYAPDEYTSKVLEGPSWAHPFGIDHLGRDQLSRVIHGARISLWVGFLAVGLSLTSGVAIGVVSGYFGGWDRQYHHAGDGHHDVAALCAPRHPHRGSTRSVP